MLRHFLYATARTSTRSLFVKPNSLFSGGLGFFSTTALTNSRPLLAKLNAPVYVSSLRSLSEQKEDSRRSPTRMALTLFAQAIAVVFGIFALAWCSASFAAHVQNTAILALQDQEEGESGLMSNWIAFRSYLRECAKAKSEFKAIKGYRTWHHTMFCPKAFVKPELMPKFKEMLGHFHVVETANYYFVSAEDSWKRERFFEQIMKLGGASEAECGGGGGGYAREEYSWSGSNAASNKNAVASRTYRSY